MTDTPAAMAREAALHFEAKKTGFGQAQDGWSLTLRIQHADVPDAVRDALKGTRYMVAMVEIGHDEMPVNRKGGGADTVPAQSTVETAPRQTGTIDKPQSGGARKRFEELSAPQQSGVLCNDPVFWKYLEERQWPHHRTVKRMYPGLEGEPLAAEVVRSICGVTSRSTLHDNATWSALVLDYRLWQRSPEFVE